MGQFSEILWKLQSLQAPLVASSLVGFEYNIELYRGKSNSYNRWSNGNDLSQLKSKNVLDNLGHSAKFYCVTDGQSML